MKRPLDQAHLQPRRRRLRTECSDVCGVRLKRLSTASLAYWDEEAKETREIWASVFEDAFWMRVKSQRGFLSVYFTLYKQTFAGRLVCLK